MDMTGPQRRRRACGSAHRRGEVDDRAFPPMRPLPSRLQHTTPGRVPAAPLFCGFSFLLLSFIFYRLTSCIGRGVLWLLLDRRWWGGREWELTCVRLWPDCRNAILYLPLLPSDAHRLCMLSMLRVNCVRLLACLASERLWWEIVVWLPESLFVDGALGGFPFGVLLVRSLPCICVSSLGISDLAISPC